MSATVSGVLPTLAASMEANVAALHGKETMFAGNVAASNAMYAGSEDSGQQGVMQIVQMLGQMGGQAGQMGEMAGAPGQMFGQMGSQFGQLMQPMMQGFQGSGQGGHGQASGGQGAAAAGGGQGPAAMGIPPQHERDDEARAQPDTREHADRDGPATAGPGDNIRRGLEPLPAMPPEQSHGDRGEDLARRV
ncbi:hypothetical protein [Mycobacterium sp.]|uniref:hypothetical protein n=1 Tax=Mycobacterium sp. TaxID=1785 RepID=UPI0031DC4497